jgi:hypothetical protein
MASRHDGAVWARIDVQTFEHPKLATAGFLATAMHLRAVLYCREHLTDGRVPGRMARRWEWEVAEDAGMDSVPALAARLVELGVWEQDGDGFAIVSYLDWQESADEVTERRERMRELAERRWARKSERNAEGDAPRIAQADAPRIAERNAEKEKEKEIERGDTDVSPSAKSAKVDAPDWDARAADALAALGGLASPAQRLAEVMASENATGKVALSRVVRSLYEPLAEMAGELGHAAVGYGLAAAIQAGAPNANYVKKAARSYTAPAARGGAASGSLSRYNV